MAQTKKKRRRKQRGTQGGRIDNTTRSRPRSRAEAKARARTKRKPTARVDAPPTWRGSITRGLAAAVIFFFLLLLIFQRPFGTALALSAFMLAFYVPGGYFIDMTLWRRRERARMRSQGN